ncbi:MAG: cold shock domain-containing protein [Leptospiraceae bacterium]|nr:cold shock domain-containing protein [Leptospiraceae bacterium]MDW8306212.1 cold shock domain-containing protein [Leptospiraceae bacterium]
MQYFLSQYGDNLSVRFPFGILPKISEISNSYFGYLRDSEFKSNICNLLQLLEYQRWIYKLFKPNCSLADAFFYQQWVTMGIVAEALAVAILLDPCIDEKSTQGPSTRSIKAEYEDLHDMIYRRNFAQNIELLYFLKVINEDLRKSYHKIRTQMRNMVHLQGWQGRLDGSLGFEKFSASLDEFYAFLNLLSEKVQIKFTVMDLRKALEYKRKAYVGEIVSYNEKRGFGFIDCYDFHGDVFFHVSKVKFSHEKLFVGAQVSFRLELTRKGHQAYDIQLF